MKISRIITAGALAATLILAGCSTPEAEETPEPTTSASEEPSESPTSDEETPDSDDAAAEGEGGQDATGNSEIDPSINADAHPFCAVLAKYDDQTEIEGTPTEADISRIKNMRDDAVAAAPSDIKKDVEVYFDWIVTTSENAVKTGEMPEMDIEDLDEDFQKAFGAILGFSFETCFDLGLDIDTE